MKYKSKKKLNFTEKLGLVIVCFAIAWVQQNYILAFMDKAQINETVTVTLITAVIGTFLGLSLKSLFEKLSMNKHKIDVSTGKPYNETEEEE